MRALKDLDEIITIEGIGTPSNMHPLQVAWNTAGAVQCGFCSPGFIVSAYALLKQNPSPTRQEVRSWFKKNRNVCRCTGYHPIVDAVMLAAECLRGEKTLDEITYHIPADGKAYGTPFPRRESGVSRVTGLANYGDDIRYQLPKYAVEVAPVISRVAHAKILYIDYEEAEKMPGVIKVITARDVPGSNRIVIGVGHPMSKAIGDERPILCDEKVFKYGDVVALVAAETIEQARKAAKAVIVEYEDLPEHKTVLDSVAEGAAVIHEGIPNRFVEWPKHKGEDTRRVWDKCAHTIEGSFSTTREPHMPIEPDCAQAYVDDEGILTIQYKSQFLYFVGMTISDGIDWDPEKIRAIENESGGSFGYSVSPYLPALAAVATVALDGKPVSITLTYEEHQHMTGKRAPSYANVKYGVDENGKLMAMDYHLTYDIGAYTEFPFGLMLKAHVGFGWPYNIPNMQGLIACSYTNYGYATTYRSFGYPQTLTSSEGLIDILARELGQDPFEFRYKNIAREGDLSGTGVAWNEYPFVEMMDMMRPKYEAALTRKAEANAAAATAGSKDRYGVGVAWGGYLLGDPIDQAHIYIELGPDGCITTYSTWQDVGQHAEAGQLLHTYEALRPMNVPYEKIRVEMNDTASCPNTGCSGGSRMHVHTGNAILDGAKKLMDAMRKDDGSYRTYEEMVSSGIATRYEGITKSAGTAHILDVNTAQGKPFEIMMYNLFLIEVHVNIETGKTTVDRIVSVCDVGRIGNLLGVEGQAYGGMMHSIGFALKEDYSDMKKHSSMVGAGTLEIDEMPDDIELIWHDSYRENGPHGSAGCSENFQSSPHVAVINAIDDAVGVRVYELPARPEVILKSLAEIEAGKKNPLKPEKYYLGCELYEELDYLTENPVSEEVNRQFMGIE
jgi:aldehyde oxidoreductase